MSTSNKVLAFFALFEKIGATFILLNFDCNNRSVYLFHGKWLLGLLFKNLKKEKDKEVFHLSTMSTEILVVHTSQHQGDDDGIRYARKYKKDLHIDKISGYRMKIPKKIATSVMTIKY
ncbi:transmembrane protein, putative [Medicago truncatula]|uniref:Transmembrane protein, putative n=1 Tax=Medicago truncatula TaxID=3880 RepID=A0A072V1X6_MEDTR|nr:transmembrane protein, putative [Medicago truncatula]